MGRSAYSWAALLASLCVLLVSSTAWAITVPPRPERGVSDTAGVLTAAQREALEEKIVSFHQEEGPSIAVALVPSLGGDGIKEASYEVASTWKVGNEDRNDGVLFLVGVAEAQAAGPGAKKCGCIRIEVGSYLEGALTDTETREILKQTGPLVVAGDFYEATNVAVGGIMSEVSSTQVAAASAENEAPSGSSGFWVLGFLATFGGLGFIALFAARDVTSRQVEPRSGIPYLPPTRPTQHKTRRRAPSRPRKTSPTKRKRTSTTRRRSTTTSSSSDDGFGSWGGSSGGGGIDFGGDFGGGGSDW